MPAFISQYIEVCLFGREGNNAHYLLLQRAATEKVYPAMWQIITAKIEAGETALQTAHREIAEETSLMPLAMWNVPFVNTFYDVKRDAISFIPFFAAEIPLFAVPVLSKEHQHFAWLSYEEAKETLVWNGQREGLSIVQEFIVGKKDAERFSRIII